MDCPDCDESFSSIRAAVLHEETTGHAIDIQDARTRDTFWDEGDDAYAKLKESW